MLRFGLQMDATSSRPNPLLYLKALFSDWLTAMYGGGSVVFTAIVVFWAHASVMKLLWSCLAIVSFVIAGYRVWSKERTVRINELSGLNLQIASLKRKPYEEELGTQAAELIGRLSAQGVTLLRHLLVNEPIEVGRRFKPDIAQDIQDAQLAIAFRSGIVRHNEVWAGGHLLRTNYVVNPQFRNVLQDLLYQADVRYMHLLGQF